MPKQDIYISMDVEADGPIPADYSMSSFGAVVADDMTKTFYAELKPITSRFDPQAAAVSGLDRDKLTKFGMEPSVAMRDLNSWVLAVAGGRKPIFVAFNATFDWGFVNWYFHHFVGSNPFGISGLDVKAYYMGLRRKMLWADTAKRNIPKVFMSSLPHTHNALDDAKEQAEMFMKLRDEAIKMGPL